MSVTVRIILWCTIGLSLSLFLLQAQSAKAQSSLLWQPDINEYNSLQNVGWNYVRQAGCPQPTWQPDYTSLNAYQTSVATLRADLQTRLGPLPTTAAGGLIEEQKLIETDLYTVSWVRIASRLPGVSVFGYWARPLNPSQAHPAVIVLHGDGAPPHIAFDWRLSGDEDYVQQASPKMLTGVATALLDAGYSVFVPWLSDDLRWWYPWYEFDRWGAILAQKSGKGNAYSLLVPQIMASVDFLSQDPEGSPNAIALMGWEQGAQVAGITAALDERVSALVWLGPLVDKHRWRLESWEGISKGAAFEHMDCSWGQAEIAALVAPRPLLFSDSPVDSAYAQYAFTGSGSYISPTIATTIQTIYANLAYTESTAYVTNNDLTIAGSALPIAWLNQRFAFSSPPAFLPKPLSPPADWAYPILDHNTMRNEIANYLATLGPCSTATTAPTFTSIADFRASVQPLQSQVLNDLIGGEIPPQRPIKILDRQVIMNTPTYTLEWVRFLGRFSGENDYIAGYLATPITGSTQKPAILSMMGYEPLNTSFGITTHPMPYLNAYGDYLARNGYIVFVPYIISPFDGWGALLQVRTDHQSNIWHFLLPFYMSGIDFLTTQPNVDGTRIGVYGLSYGGLAALYTAAFDSRISTVVYSDPPINFPFASTLSGFAGAPLWLSDLCSTANQVLPLLIAPRRLIWENGILDENGRQHNPTEMVDQVRRIYDQLGIGQRFEFVQHEGGHETRPWLFTTFYPPPMVEGVSFISNTKDNVPERLQIHGSNFLAVPHIQLDTTPLTITLATSTTVETLTPVGLAEGVPYTLTVENFDGYSASQLLTADFAPPSGAIYLEPDRYFVNQDAVNLRLSANDNLTGVTQMRLDNEPTFAHGSWQPYNITTTWQLLPGDSAQTIYAQYRDQTGNLSLIYSRTLFLDMAVPTGTLTINGNAVDTLVPQVKLKLAANDSGSGVVAVLLSNDGMEFSQPISLTDLIEWTLPGDIGTHTVYGRFIDAAGNQSNIVSDTIQLLSVGAQATGVLINQGARFANSRTVTLTIVALPDTAEMAIRDSVSAATTAQKMDEGAGNDWQWVPYQVTRTWTLGDFGPNFPQHVIYVQFRDIVGNVSQTYWSDLLLDETAPTGSIIINDQAADTATNVVTLTLTSLDELAGVAEMQVANEADFIGANWQPYQSTLIWVLASDNGPKTVYVRYKDRAGNLSATYQATILLRQLANQTFLPLIIR